MKYMLLIYGNEEAFTSIGAEAGSFVAPGVT